MKKLPIGIKTFEKIRNKHENYIYVDKTKYALELIQSGIYYFLSRPKRFGKSLFLSTLKSIFEGKKELFEGLYIYDKWNWEEKYPVIYISLANEVLRSAEDIQNTIKNILKENQKNLGVDCKYTNDIAGWFSELIINTSKKYGKKVVILIDDCDKPVLDNIENVEIAKLLSSELVHLYSVMKEYDHYIKFMLMTGVIKFSMSSIFSGFNNVYNISLDKRYGNICGYTQEELESNFSEWLQGVDLNELKEWYNGYNFLADNLYNPFDILLFLKNDRIFKNYWFKELPPIFFMKLIETKDYFLPNLYNPEVNDIFIGTIDVEYINLEVVLFQTGYLSIDSIEHTTFGSMYYKLRFPNKEVKISFNNFILDNLIDDKASDIKKSDLYNSLFSQDVEGVKNSIVSIFASIPSDNKMKNSDWFHANILYIYLQSLSVDIIEEDLMNRRNIVITLRLPNSIYIMGLNITDEDPLAKIRLQKYYEKYLNEGKNIYLVGMVFDRLQKNLKEFVWERLVVGSE